MKKKLAVVLLLTAIAVGSVSALDFTKYAEGIGDSKFFINFGIGWGPGIGDYEFKRAVPPISASVEYALPISLPITVGGYFGITTYDETRSITVGSGFFTYYTDDHYTGTLVGVGLKAAYHIDFGVRNLDAYAGLLLGVLFWPYEITYSNNNVIDKSGDDNQALLGIHLGARYFFTDMFGAYIELGYSQMSVISLGLAVKF
jgi:hypothetical protein